MKPTDEPTPQQVESACIAFNENFRHLLEIEQLYLRHQAMSWLDMWQKQFDQQPRSIAKEVRYYGSVPPCEHGTLTLIVEVPPEDRSNRMHDIAEAYAVESGDTIPGGCIIWGLYRGQWFANVSGRWLVRHLMAKVE